MTLRRLAERTIDFLRERSRSYKLAYSGFRIDKRKPETQFMLQDLAKFCRANETCFHADPRKHAVLEGRREVWLRIANHLRLSPDQLYAIYTGQTFIEQEEDTQ